MKTTLYYFTGSGNSLKAAKDLKEHLGGDCELVRITHKNISAAPQTDAQAVGIVYPVYYVGLPYMVSDFIANLPLKEGVYYFILATCGGMDVASTKQAADIFKQRNGKLSAAFRVRLPGNYQIMYSPYSSDYCQKMYQAEENKIAEIAQTIKDKKEDLGAIYPSFFAALGNLIYKITFNPRKIGKHFWADDKCTSCGICAKVCPAGNIRIIDGKPQWGNKCESCLACLHWCPVSAVQYKKATLNKERYRAPQVKAEDLFVEGQ